MTRYAGPFELPSTPYTEFCIELGAVVADNASTNDVMITGLAALNPRFKGTAMHIRCFDHTLNLMAKVCLCLGFRVVGFVFM